MRSEHGGTKTIHMQSAAAFRRYVYARAKEVGRDFPWRHTDNPYRILVSEVMLQQTQADRVVPKYRAFLSTFPTFRSLALAPRRDVLCAWQGLGYNRRAVSLHLLAQAVSHERRGQLPRNEEELRILPGIGPYTAGAIAAFAFNAPSVIIETNIRTVFLHHFFVGETGVPDSALMPCIEATLDRTNPRAWYQALMDYGSTLKRTKGNASVRSKHYTRQAAFSGSRRELRGAIVRFLTMESSLSPQAIAKRTGRNLGEVRSVIGQLADERLVARRGGAVMLAQ